ncbi:MULTISPECIES: heparan-alpha-glucosaminide N-acetyltransferase [Stappiaceae]|jgi:uncharacterized membrane protein|uniref:heparan-alpha-glucosaminide N-acetyltransferase n=1 Tax=Stappiaceae TaxID=2821832 RepID=UPI00094B3A5A|nr:MULTISPECIES: heparan-alpha-glucosaminide N-acetyltransferase [Stappiaceae]MBO9463244.1 DUF1624 domain-containing protein [Labrenzia sp. R5_0]UES53901.1 DUF1624 domain-containing protein [Roseibium aggregatum]UFI06755.1 DUF1624 domain-containing protein [Roseibium aggregatum]
MTGSWNSSSNLTNHRILLVDAVRGIAIAGVVLFHVVWDLELSGLVRGLAFNSVWLLFGRLLAGTFMFLVGVSLVLAHNEELKLKKFAKRVLVIVTAAFTISIVTSFAFPETYIYFGILHAIAVSSLLGVLFLRLPPLGALSTGLVFLIVPQFVALDLLNTRWFAWTGLSAFPPPSNDFVPILPWAGLTMIGIFLTKVSLSKNFNSRSAADLPDTQLTRSLVWMGRNSLLIYLVHQPLLFGIIFPISYLLDY